MANALTTFLDEIIFSSFFPTRKTSSSQLILYVLVVKIHFNNSSYVYISTFLEIETETNTGYDLRINSQTRYDALGGKQSQ